MRRIERQRTRHCAAAHSRSHVRARRVGVQRCSVSYECIVYMQVGVCSQQSLPLFCFQSLGKNILVCLYVKSILEFFFVGLISLKGTENWKHHILRVKETWNMKMMAYFKATYMNKDIWIDCLPVLLFLQFV